MRMTNKFSLVKKKINKSVSLYKKGLFKEALVEAKLLTIQYPNVALIHNIYGITSLSLNDWDQSVNSFSKAIKLKPDYVDAHYNLGIALKNLGRMEESILSYTKALELKPNYVKAYDSLIRILTFYNPKKPNLNPCVVANKLLKTINYSYDSSPQISDNDVATFFQRCNDVIFKNINHLNLDETQIYRVNTSELNCRRHFQVFNTFNVIPEFCFGCYKVQLEPKNVMELFKLYFVFDNLNLRNNNTRKCMLEFRPEVSGNYKGYIYCSSLSEAKEIKNQLVNTLNKKINKNIPIAVKRGCSEFGIAHPEYKKIDQKDGRLMEYNKKWREKEKIIDNKLTIKNRSKQKVLQNSLSGISVSDILIMRNWLAYAKKIGDLSYKKIIKEVMISPIIEKILSDQLSKHKKKSPAPD